MKMPWTKKPLAEHSHSAIPENPYRYAYSYNREFKALHSHGAAQLAPLLQTMAFGLAYDSKTYDPGLLAAVMRKASIELNGLQLAEIRAQGT